MNWSNPQCPACGAKTITPLPLPSGHTLALCLVDESTKNLSSFLQVRAGSCSNCGYVMLNLPLADPD